MFEKTTIPSRLEEKLVGVEQKVIEQLLELFKIAEIIDKTRDFQRGKWNKSVTKLKKIGKV